METLDSSATETVVFPPQIHAASTNTTTTITDTVNFQPDRHVHRDDGNGLDLEAQDGTLERLVNKTNELSYEVPSEDKDVDDGQQPLGIVESCFPYLARRNHHHTAPGKGPFSQLGFCPGVRCYYPSVGYDEEATQYAAVSRVEMEDFPSEDYSTIFSNSDGDMVATSRRFRMGEAPVVLDEVIVQRNPTSGATPIEDVPVKTAG